MLKALWTKKFEKVPSKTHDLEFLRSRLEIAFPDEKTTGFISYLNELSVPTRYPEKLRQMTKEFNSEKATSTIEQTKEILVWLKQMLKK
jgi:HEPN domain-containing protein